MTSIYDDDPVRDAEMAAEHWAENRRREQAITDAAEQLCTDVWEDLVSYATATMLGQHDDAAAANTRALHRVADADPRVLESALIQGMWSFARDAATAQLKALRDCHYIDERRGLLPRPPGGAR